MAIVFESNWLTKKYFFKLKTKTFRNIRYKELNNDKVYRFQRRIQKDKLRKALQVLKMHTLKNIAQK